MIIFYYQTKIPISFWCRRGSNFRSFIQPSETLPIELTGTHNLSSMLVVKNVIVTSILFVFNILKQKQFNVLFFQ